MENTHTPYIGSGRFSYEFVAGRPTAGTLYVWIYYREYALTGLYKSTDYGETWEQFMDLDTMTGGDSDFFNLHFNPTTWDMGLAASDDYVFVALRNSTTAMGIWRIPHAGGSATKVHTGPTGSNAGKCSARIAASPDGHVVQSMYSTSTFFDPVMGWSNDNGDNWIELKHLSDNTISGVQRVQWWAINPDDGDELIVSYYGAVYRTTNANAGTGCTWTELQFGLGAAGRCSSKFDVRFSPSLAISCALISNNKVLVSDDYATADAYVTDLLSAAGGNDITSNYARAYHPSEDKLYVVDDESKVWELNGTHPPTSATLLGTLPVWYCIQPGYSWSYNGGMMFDDKDEDVMYILQNHAGLMRSADGGVTWYAKGALPTDYNGVPVYHIKDKMTDDDGTALASHTPDIDFAAGGWTEEAGAIEIDGGAAVESTPGSSSIGLIDMGSGFGMTHYIYIMDIEAADPLDVFLFLRYQDATHYLKLRLYSSGGDLLSSFIYNNGAGEVVFTGPYTYGTMPTEKIRVVALYAYGPRFYVFTGKTSSASEYEKLGIAGRLTILDSEMTVGFGFGATDAGSRIDQFHITEPHSTFADHWWVGTAGDSIDGRVAGNYYATGGGATPPTHNPGGTWQVTSGDEKKLTTRSVAVEGVGGGTESRAITDAIALSDILIDTFQWDPRSDALHQVGCIFRLQDDDNYLMAGAEVTQFKVWEVVSGTPTVLASEGHSFGSSGYAYLWIWALGRHICVFGYKSGETPEVVMDANEESFEEETGFGIWHGGNILPGGYVEIYSTGLIRELSLPAYSAAIRNMGLVIS